MAVLARALTDRQPGADDSVRIDRIRALEELRSLVSAVQAQETAEFVTSQRAAQTAAGVPAERVGRGVTAQVGLARRISPHSAARHVGWCMTLVAELPATFAELQDGRVSEWRAMIVARETAWLSREHRAEIDRQLAPQLHTLGDRKVESEAKRLAYTLDPAGYVARLRQAENERHVSLRPAPDAMTRLTALLPLTHGVACQAALTRAADETLARGDERSKGQVMADTLVERVTGQRETGQVPVTVNLIMTDQALFDDGPEADEPVTVVADGTPATVIPAAVARRAAADLSGDSAAFLRRLYRRPGRGDLAAMDSAARCFTANQRLFLLLRDQTCRTPYCDAPVRHADHVLPVEDGGHTTIVNGQGLCEACNHTKQAAGWRQDVDPDGDVVVTTTPTGHQYRSRAPDHHHAVA